MSKWSGYLFLGLTLCLASCSFFQTESTITENSKVLGSRKSASITFEQKAVDDNCNVQYSQSAGRCNEEAGNDESAFDKCLLPLKQDLKKCCDTNGGSAKCSGDPVASKVSNAKIRIAKKLVDDTCNVQYSQSAGRCAQEVGDDDKAFDQCLLPIKQDLKKCCDTNGGSAKCSEDAISP